MPYKNNNFDWKYYNINPYERLIDSDEDEEIYWIDEPIQEEKTKKTVIDDEYIKQHTVTLLSNLSRVLPNIQHQMNSSLKEHINQYNLMNNQKNNMSSIRNERYKDITNLIEFIPYNVIKNNFQEFDVKNGKITDINKFEEQKIFVENELYKIKKYDEDIPMNQQIFRLVKILKQNELVLNDTLVMKLISGPNNGIYSLTKLDCKMLNIPYESGLQLFSTELNWTTVSDSTEKEQKIDNNFYCDGKFVHLYFKLNDVYAIQRKTVKIQDKYECELSQLMSCLDIRYNNNKRLITDLILNDFTTQPYVRSEVIIHGLISLSTIKEMKTKILLNVTLDTYRF